MFDVVIISLFCLIVNGQQYVSNKTSFDYDPSELLSKIFSGNVTQPRRIIKFDDNFGPEFVSFENQNLKIPNPKPFRFEADQEINNPNVYSTDNNGVYDNNGASHVRFDELVQNLPENAINNSLDNGIQHSKEGNGGKKKKRRRRKPKQQFPNQGVLNPAYIGPIGPGPGPVQNLGPNRLRPEFNGQFYRPPRRPQPSLASGAFEAVTGTLMSIAHNDDYQCVARLLCEAAAGGALGGSSLLESVSGLQPLLTLLSAYNGISSNPLFVFGRAAFLGMSSKQNPGSCRYAYPLCPTDPEQLVHYLNNHNGGFFRFFNAPQQGQQNLEQFYNQLSHNYGLYEPESGINQEFYGLLNPGLQQGPGSQSTLYTGYGYQQNYVFAYPYNQNYNNGNRVTFKNNNDLIENKGQINFNTNGNKIEKRIQNKPSSFLNSNSEAVNSKWLFPGEDDQDGDENLIGVQYVNDYDFGFTGDRKVSTFRFPDNQASNNDQEYNIRPINSYNEEIKRNPKSISFPGSQNNFHDYIPPYSKEQNFFFNNVNQETVRGNFERINYNYYNINNNNNVDKDPPGVTTVYVVRGNGDPSKPEIVKLRPGETL